MIFQKMGNMSRQAYHAIYRKHVDKNVKTFRAYKKDEKEIQTAILEYLELKKITAWAVNNGAFKVGNRFIKIHQDSKGNIICGIPDIIGHLPNGKALYIEVKTQKGILRPSQRGFLSNSKGSGCFAMVARSISDVEKALKRVGL